MDVCFEPGERLCSRCWSMVASESAEVEKALAVVKILFDFYWIAYLVCNFWHELYGTLWWYCVLCFILLKWKIIIFALAKQKTLYVVSCVVMIFHIFPNYLLSYICVHFVLGVSFRMLNKWLACVTRAMLQKMKFPGAISGLKCIGSFNGKITK